MQKKTIQKSIRISNSVFEYIEKYKGDNFSEKFENLILYCMKEEKNITKRVTTSEQQLKDLNSEIDEKSKLLLKLRVLEQKLDGIFNAIE